MFANKSSRFIDIKLYRGASTELKEFSDSRYDSNRFYSSYISYNKSIANLLGRISSLWSFSNTQKYIHLIDMIAHNPKLSEVNGDQVFFGSLIFATKIIQENSHNNADEMAMEKLRTALFCVSNRLNWSSRQELEALQAFRDFVATHMDTQSMHKYWSKEHLLSLISKVIDPLMPEAPKYPQPSTLVN